MGSNEKHLIVEKAWKKFIRTGEVGSEIAPEIVKSWMRCQEKHSPLKRAPLDKLEQARYKERLEKNRLFVDAALPIMEDLFQTIKGSGFSVILTDSEGYILKRIGDAGFVDRADRVQLSEGVNWHENFKGTNAIGVALQEQCPITVYAAEHFHRENHFLTCSAAPVFDEDYNLLGILDISGNFERAHPHNLGLALAAAKAIQNRYLLVKKGRAGAVTPHTYSARYDFSYILGNNYKIREAIKLAKRAAQSDSTVLLQGESGTGKELFAQAIHNYSSRKDGPFVALNCGAIPETLLESEIFGYEPGAFTGAKAKGQEGKIEAADGGTLFLDEIGELPLDSQTALLRVLQDGCLTRLGGSRTRSVNIRVIAATNKDLYEKVKKGSFRLDLYYRINVISIEIPPLRERTDDIELLTEHYLGKLGHRFKRTAVKVSPEVKKIFLSYQWPGNIRELINVLERAMHISDDDLILPEHLPRQVKSSFLVVDSLPPMEEAEINLIKWALAETGNNIKKASGLLGISRATLYRKLVKYNFNPRLPGPE
ncbi:MAG: sigma-54-dependent Fis family transcriptional regulator [Peptococcaceae bacterium]|jgi:transcriptional regulator of acetoin/glycerol metabolism|nr:sigma-54-dependent Fis family transcriptional regulator [Peptococcaceae bacterium]MDH7523874.1 sigma-54-dependent Fis family transcriptional regulator [Peptococcaceae bacterium]